MRLIDADKLLEDNNIQGATKYENKNVQQENHSYSTVMMYEIAGIIEDAPTIEVPQWIPCSERLPEPYKRVLVCDEEGSDIMQVAYITNENRFRLTWNFDFFEEVIAWMPLPQAYTGNELD